MLSKEELNEGLTTKVVGRKLFVFESIDSTNACAKTLAETGAEEGVVVLAEHQTQGRGRHGRSWQSEPGTNLLFSCLLRPPLARERAALLTFYASASVACAIESVSSLLVETKWPNDLLLHGKKCCGILLETSFAGDRIDYAILGIGINVNQHKFPDELHATATSLALEAHTDVDRKKLFQRVLLALDDSYARIVENDFTEVLAAWKQRCTMFGRTVRIGQNGKTIEGTAERLNSDGGLVIATSEGKQVVYAGDVTVLP